MSNSSKKKVISICIVVAMMATLVIGATLAYFSDSETKTNTFVIGNAIDLTLKEPDPDNKDDPKPPQIDGENPITGKKDTKDPNGGLIYDPVVPGACYSKAPYITLSGQKAHVYMELTMNKAEYEALYAVAKQYCEKQGTEPTAAEVGAYIADMVKFPSDVSHKLVGLKEDPTKGVAGTYGVVFYYGELKDKTNYFLMSGVKIPDEFNSTDMANIKTAYGTADGLKLNVTAYAIQAEGVTEKQAFDSCFVDLGYTYQTTT